MSSSPHRRVVAFGIAAAFVTLVISPRNHAVAERVVVSGPLVVGADGRVEVALQRWPRGGHVDLPWDGPPLSAAVLSTSPQQFVSSWEIRPGDQSLRVNLARAENTQKLPVLSLESLSGTRQYPDGRYVFSVADAQTPKVPDSDRAYGWDFDVSRPGNYAVEVTGQAGDFRGQPVEVHIGKDNAAGMLEDTGRRARVVNTAIGRLRLSQPGRQHLLLKLGEGRGAARHATVLAVVLRPAPEGEDPIQDRDSTVTLRARSATIHGVKAQYHPEPHMDAVAFWTEPTDWVSWNFKLNQPGRYDVELLEACASGHSGSEIEVSIDGQLVRSTVPDTGGWQRFQSRVIGEVELPRAGDFQLAVKPVRKAGDAIMDLRQVRLVPKSPMADAKRDRGS